MGFSCTQKLCLINPPLKHLNWNGDILKMAENLRKKTCCWPPATPLPWMGTKIKELNTSDTNNHIF